MHPSTFLVTAGFVGENTVVEGSAPVTPTVDSVSDVDLPLEGQSGIVITGSDFVAPIEGVTIGGTACTDVVFNDSTSITCTAPAKAEGTYNIVVTNAGGLTGTLFNGIAYWDPPFITSVDPTTLDLAGGSLTITGHSFLIGNAVTVGGEAATGVTRNSEFEIVCTAPALTAGTYDVVVTNTATGSSDTLENAVTYSEDVEDGTIGNTTSDSSIVRGANEFFYTTFQPSVAGQVSYIWMRADAGTAADDYTLGIYNAAGNILAYHAVVNTGVDTVGWYGGALSTPVTLSAATDYIIGAVLNQSTTTYRDDSLANHHRRRIAMTYATTLANADFSAPTTDNTTSAYNFHCNNTGTPPA